ncbi:hypothetical protein PX52LOC_05788 [Limnoglobus roseus]|uniref:Uncharacterized protein n=1 Tax=Limnoglobus roseus TaxID=2598579 RepID=A0A5C1AHT2_9BACT|nr:hypothetical protein PX52LOC_05788 [Limnoglobus roseus]
MTKATHTPGPWRVDSGMGSLSYVRAKSGELVASCTWMHSDGKPIEAQANARLIAAAPDLLDALEAMWDSACTNASSTPSKAAFIKAHAAINKAKGLAA